MSDPLDEVRNSAMRSLLVFAEVVPTEARPVLYASRPSLHRLSQVARVDRSKQGVGGAHGAFERP